MCLRFSRYFPLIAAVLIGSTTAWADAGQEADPERVKPLVFGFVPIVSADRVAQRFAPLSRYVGKQLGREVRFESARNFKTFHRRTMRERRYDILFTAPHLYVSAQHEVGYRVVARIALPPMKALIVVPKNSEITSLGQLRGRSLATVDEIALASILVRRTLSKHGLNPGQDVSILHTPSHAASVLAAVGGVTDAGSAMKVTYERVIEPEVKDKLRIIASTDETPHMPFAIAPWVEQDLAAGITDALLNMHSSQEGRAILDKLRWPRLISSDPREYEELEYAVEALKKLE